jgi:L-methionine (R)-S-oxide reductase
VNPEAPPEAEFDTGGRGVLMQAELEGIIGRFGADTGTIHFIEDGLLILKAHVGVPPQVVQIVARVPIGKGMAGLAAERNQPVSTCNIQADTTGDIRLGAKQTGVSGAVVVPIRDGGGRVVGTLGIGVRRQHAYTGAETARLLEEAALLAQGRVSECERP